MTAPRAPRISTICRSFLAFLLPLVAACTPPAEAKAPEGHAAGVVPPGPIHHVLLITVDGMLPDSYEHPDAHGLSIPNLRRLVAQGAASDGALSVFPSVTYPSHTSMVTGAFPGRHRIVSNLAFDPMETDLGGWNWYAEDIAREPVWRLAAKAGYDVAIVHWPVTVGAQVRYRVPEYWRAKDANDKKLERALSTPGLLDDVAREHPDFWSRFNPPDVHDDALTDIATYLLRTAKPTLMLLHLVEVDGEQHAHGIFSPEAVHAIENADAQIGRVLREVEQDGLAKDTAIVVASDHGFMNVHAMVRPGVALRDAGLVTVDGAGKVTDWKATALVSSAQAYIYVRDPHDEATRKAAHDLFVAKTHDPASGIGRVFEPDEIRALGGDAQAAFAIEATPGYALGSGSAGEYAAPSPYKGTHGYDPRRPEMRASLILYGPNVPRGTLGNARLVDIGPTIAGWLGIAMPGTDGVPLQVTAGK